MKLGLRNRDLLLRTKKDKMSLVYHLEIRVRWF